MQTCVPLLLVGLLVGIARAQDGYIMGFFTDSTCNFGAQTGIPAPVPYTTGVCQSIPENPLGNYFNVTEVGGGFAFNTECDSACSLCQQVIIDPNECTPLPGSNFYVQWFQVKNQELFMRGYIDPNCKTPGKLQVRLSTGNCTNTGNDLTGYSIMSQTSADELIISTKCDSECERCAAVYKKVIGECFEVIKGVLYLELSSTISVAASAVLVVVLALLAL